MVTDQADELRQDTSEFESELSEERAGWALPEKVVGIGASLGGMEAAQTLFGALPRRTGCAFLLVQDAASQDESVHAERLAASTHMPVIDATDGTVVEAEHVYVAPKAVSMTVEAGVIRVKALGERQGTETTFDILLKSLAGDYRERAIAVVLSGSGSAGAAAVPAIEAAGGLVVVQDPDEADFDGMPTNAIAAADHCLVLSVAEIAEVVVRHSPSTIASPAAASSNIDHHTSATMLLSRNHEHLYSVGPTERFLQTGSGPASDDIFTLLPESLHGKLRSAIDRATEERKLSVESGAKLDGSEASFSIHAEVMTDTAEELLLVSFVEEPTDTRQSPPVQDGDGAQLQIAERQRKLAETRALLKGTVRNLRASARSQRAIEASTLPVTGEPSALLDGLPAGRHPEAVPNDLEAVLYSIDVATLFLDKELKIRFYTPATRGLFSILRTDIGRPLADLRSLTSDDWVSDALAVLGGAASVEREVGARDGRWYIRRIKPYRSRGPTAEGVVMSYIDISLQKRMVEDKDAEKVTAEQASLAKSQFLAAASHDLRQPLQTLKLLQGMLHQVVSDTQGQIYVQRMAETLESMSGILNTALHINQIEAGVDTPVAVNFCIGDLLERLEHQFSYTAKESGLVLKFQRSSLTAYTDPRLLEQIARNLISNALRYTPSGRVVVGCRRHGDKLQLEVWDTGIGMQDSQIEEAFGEYRQLESAIEGRERGLGLGLSIVRRLSELLGLKVFVQSSLGKGSVFALEIPRAEPGIPLVALSPETARPERAAPVRRTTVLLIEDEADVRELLKSALENIGHEVHTAQSGADALALIDEGYVVPKIVVADYNLTPDMDGVTAIEAIRARLGAALPALILTGDMSTSAMRRSAENNLPQLTKPVRLQHVITTIDNLLWPSSDERDKETQPASPGTVPDALGVDIIDDEPIVRQGLVEIFESAGTPVRSFATAEQYLADYDRNRPSCIILDAYLPGLSGLELLAILKEKQHHFPIIVITGRSDVHMAVAAMKGGVFDFIEKPFSADELLASVANANEKSRFAQERLRLRDEARAKLDTLTERQREILDMILLGKPNKIIAAELGLNQRTVETHRASIMRRTGAMSLSALLKLMLIADEP